MRILAISDSHGNNDLVRAALAQAREDYGPVDVMFHMGDVERDVEELQELGVPEVYVVRGNCDYRGDLPELQRVEIGGYTFLLTHGHMQQVHGGLHRLYLLACEQEANVALFGHTHVPYFDDSDEVWFLNPGSIALPRQDGGARTFALLEIDEQGKLHCYAEELR